MIHRRWLGLLVSTGSSICSSASCSEATNNSSVPAIVMLLILVDNVVWLSANRSRVMSSGRRRIVTLFVHRCGRLGAWMIAVRLCCFMGTISGCTGTSYNRSIASEMMFPAGIFLRYTGTSCFLRSSLLLLWVRQDFGVENVREIAFVGTYS